MNKKNSAQSRLHFKVEIMGCRHSFLKSWQHVQRGSCNLPRCCWSGHNQLADGRTSHLGKSLSTNFIAT